MLALILENASKRVALWPKWRRSFEVLAQLERLEKEKK